MTDSPTTTSAPPPRPPGDVANDGRFSVNEDWAATVVGLALVVLVLAGVVTGALLGGFIPTLLPS